MTERPRCEAVVEKPEELRMRRGVGFRRHYTTHRCTRAAIADGLCRQHKKAAGTRTVARVPAR